MRCAVCGVRLPCCLLLPFADAQRRKCWTADVPSASPLVAHITRRYPSPPPTPSRGAAPFVTPPSELTGCQRTAIIPPTWEQARLDPKILELILPVLGLCSGWEPFQA